MQGSKIKVELVEPYDRTFDAVLDLYRNNRRTLGFLPVGAFAQCAEEGRLLAARAGGEIVGYAVYRVATNEAVIVHLCVSSIHRGQRIAGTLLDELLRDTSNLVGVRLLCRREYAANRLWPHYGFRNVAERVGRGHDRAPLLLWRRLNVDDAPLLSLIQHGQRGARRTVAMDANVYMDLASDVESAAESKSLLADWLEPEIVLYVTGELWNEIARNPDGIARRNQRRHLTSYPMLEAKADDLRAMCERITTVLPAPKSVSDDSDRRQLAHAVVGNADYFVTRDDTLLRHALPLEQSLGIVVTRPADLIGQIHSDHDPASYRPARLVGTRIDERAPTCEEEFLPFQCFAQAETKAAFLTICRRVATDPTRYLTRIVSVPTGNPVILYSIDRELVDGSARIALLRGLRHDLTPTLLRRILSERIAEGQQRGLTHLWCDDSTNPVTSQALCELGFVARNDSFVKVSRTGVLTLEGVESLLPEYAQAPVPEIERQLWPLKVAGSGVHSFVLPIKPHWAVHLFDKELAEYDLFGADHAVALALENVYYSAASIRIPAGSRILWYVSGNDERRVAEIRACSLCAETVRGRARDVFRQFRRLGVYGWRDILTLTNGDPNADITAYRFAFTERFSRPVPWSRLQESLKLHHGHGNPIAGPVRLPDEVFVELYSEATRARE